MAIPIQHVTVPVPLSFEDLLAAVKEREDELLKRISEGEEIPYERLKAKYASTTVKHETIASPCSAKASSKEHAADNL